MFIPRTANRYLADWLNSPIRKPLVIRGARQVGKTALVREFAKAQGRRLVEINFERRPALAALFQSSDPKDIILRLASALDETIHPEESILLLDEIQVEPTLLAQLRWFAEEMPELPVIAAGSLLEFVLNDHTFSMPVGRINYLHLEPLSFEEFLTAVGAGPSREWLTQFTWDQTIPEVLHQKYLGLLKEYTIIGGMPAAVSSWASSRALDQVNQIHHELLATYRDDFTKYAGRIPTLRLQKALGAVPKMLGEKCIYSRFNMDASSLQVKRALDLLTQARLIHRVYHVSGNGVSLAAEIKEKIFKTIFIDVGLCCASLGLRLNEIESASDLLMINRGGIAEQLVGQALRTLEPFYIEPQLYYWVREEKGSNAEIDYLMQYHDQVIPIEVKSGSNGGLKSLHLFMSLKKSTRAVRISTDFPSQTLINIKLFDGTAVSYPLYTVPLYLAGQLHRLLSDGK